MAKSTVAMFEDRGVMFEDRGVMLEGKTGRKNRKWLKETQGELFHTVEALCVHSALRPARQQRRGQD